jgi:hypothetical protein
LALGDLSSDGIMDLVLRHPEEETVSVLLGYGDGSFAAPVSYDVPETRDQAVIAELTGDDHLDIALTAMMANLIGVMAGRGDGTFAAPVYYTTSGCPWDLATGDFNGDSVADLLTATSEQSIWTNQRFPEDVWQVEVLFGTCGP